ncbi:TPA: hypothetical protein EYP44_01750 [Candidatus Bathyarchaeota archaeon]|nr:hypothetical protein [Candidatus Bathyarchaeota archaeon]
MFPFDTLSEKRKIERMADLLRSGATMLSQPCPACSTPLFRMPSGEIWCSSCNKRVLILKESERPAKALGLLLLESLEDSLMSKLETIHEKIEDENDIEEIGRLSTILSRMLDALERIRRIRSTR